MNLYLRILQYVKPYKGTVILSLLSSIFYVFFNTFSLWMVSSLIRHIKPENNSSTEQISSNLSISQKLENSIHYLIGPGDQIHQLKMLCILLLISFFIKNIFYYLNNISLSFVQNNFIQDINIVYKHLQNLSISFYDKNKIADISSIVLRDVSQCVLHSLNLYKNLLTNL